MKLKNRNAEIYIPDNVPFEKAISRTTHLAISAHQDDIEIMAYDGILKCFGSKDQWFCGIVVTDGAGSARDDLYKSYTDEEMRQIRKIEQKKAAFVGDYSALALLDYSSSSAKNPNDSDIVTELKELITAARPQYLYTHNLADKHDTHIAVATKVIQALREIPKELRPEKVYGCEVWRNLDWMNDEEKVIFDVSAHPNLAMAMLGVFDSQICGGKRYDLATAGRRIANATYSESHATDNASALSYAMDLSPLIADPNLDINDYVQEYIQRFSKNVAGRIQKYVKKRV
jgi:LmbE family N-acetylglucosaminyl deacetylase